MTELGAYADSIGVEPFSADAAPFLDPANNGACEREQTLAFDVFR